MPQVVLDQAVDSGQSQPAHRRRLDLGKSRGQRSGAEKSLRTRHDRGRDGGALRRRRRQHERSDRQREEIPRLEIRQSSSGAFESEFGVNTDSNAWAVDGLKACGIDPQAAEFTGAAPAKKTPLNFLISQQVGGGGFRYGTSGSTAEEYASQDAVRALGSGGFTATPPKPSKGGRSGRA